LGYFKVLQRTSEVFQRSKDEFGVNFSSFKVLVNEKLSEKARTKVA
jgi:hypothetical protein